MSYTADSTTITADSTAYTADMFVSPEEPVLPLNPVLPYEPDNALEQIGEPRVIVSKFGDGYEQRIEDGINNDLQKWEVTYDLKGQVTLEQIYGFFKELGGVRYFLWTPPGELTPRRFVVRKYRRSLPYGSRTVQTYTTTFEEVLA